jgi:hypothetical protein
MTIENTSEITIEKGDSVFKVVTNLGTIAIITAKEYIKEDAWLFASKIFGPVAVVKIISKSNKTILVGSCRSCVNEYVFMIGGTK